MTRQEDSATVAGSLPAPSQGIDLRLAQILVAHVFGVQLDTLLRAPRKNHQAVLARQVAMYLAHVVLGLALADVGRGFARDRTTARHACARIEALRDDDVYDRMLSWLEAMLRQAVCIELLIDGNGGKA